MTRTPPSDSVRRPVTSALILPRSRKIGRIVANARFNASAKQPSEPTAIKVSGALMRSNNDQRDAGRDQSSGKIHQARSQQIANALHVAHDARHQSAGLVGIVKSNRQAGDVLLHLLAKVGDQALRRFRQQLGQRKRSDALDQRRQQDRQNQRSQQSRSDACPRRCRSGISRNKAARTRRPC